MEHGCVQPVDLTPEGSGHGPLAQSLGAVHFGLHQAAPVVSAPHFAYLSAQAPAWGDSRIAVRTGFAFAHACAIHGQVRSCLIKALCLAQCQAEQVLDGQAKPNGGIKDNFGLRLRLRLPLAAANHRMRLSSQTVSEPRDFKAAL